ncbi:MFS transporter [Nocardioides sp. BP30]|uniref:MFS transporter n=1 Tax=Nocardioides sp. BP30 TaxID=3036374 RepID=UPI0024690525|nr:MFS transporter [Nocardioides sp. BP30]WGL51402.1 MFS transporter [Nocardioides sp. BP30]
MTQTPLADPLRATSNAGRWVLVATILGSGLAGIDQTVVGVALPTIGRDLGASFAGLQWTVSAYTLTLASLILWGGALGDRFGRRRAFLSGVVAFTAASALCAAAPNITFLILARAVQGMGGALLTPASLALIESSFVPEDRARAIGTWAGFSGVATALAPFVGGWILAAASWRWVFLINLPMAALVIALTLRHVPESRQDRHGRAAGARSGASDWQGAVLTVVGLGTLTWAALGSSGSGAVAERVAAVAVAAVAFTSFVLVERRSDHPLVPLDLFADRTFSVTNVATFLLYGAIGCFFFLLVIALQLVCGFSPLAAGAASLPVTVLTLALSARSGELAARIGPRTQMSLGPLVCAVGVVLTLRLSPDSNYWVDVLPAVLLFGLGLVTFVAPLTSTALSSAPTENAGVASGVNNAVARSGTLLAVAVIPVLTGLSGDAFGDVGSFRDGYRACTWAIAALLVGASVMAAVGLPRVCPRLRAPRCRPDPVAGSPGH